MKPKAIRWLWDRWMAFARVLGNFNSRLILTLFYFLILGLFSLLIGRWKNSLRKRLPPQSNWLPVSLKEMDLSQARRQS